jgi:hypothetical protein
MPKRKAQPEPEASAMPAKKSRATPKKKGRATDEASESIFTFCDLILCGSRFVDKRPRR